MAGPAQAVSRTNDRQIMGNGVIPGQHQMIAVIDYPVELRVMIASAAPTRLRGAINDIDGEPRPCQFDRRRQPGHARTNDMCLHRNSHNFPTVKISATLLTLIRSRGGAQPTACIRPNIL